MLFPFVLLGAMLVGWGYMVSVAINDPGFSVEKDYYEKAVGWDDRQAQRAHNRTLGWRLTPRLEPDGGSMRLTVTLTDRHGVALRDARVAVTTFHVARGARQLEASLAPVGEGTYSAVLPMRRAGIWEMRYVVDRDGEHFTWVDRQELIRGGAE
jgi:nitrogen fixation protein FixH